MLEFPLKKKEHTPKPALQKQHGEHRTVPKPRKHLEMKICGLHACKMVFTKRPQDLIRVYITEPMLKEMNKILKHCAEHKLAYRILSEEEMCKVSESNHHEGVCFLIKRTPAISYLDFLKNESLVKSTPCIVALENVQNPHNLGAIMRVCANFGVKAILVSQPDSALSGSAYRTSEGGAEFIKVITADHFDKAIQKFKASDYRVITTSSHKGTNLFNEKLPLKSIIVFGSENSGISEQILDAGDKIIKIPSSGSVESLNIACASSVILAEYWRTHKA